jgi:sortase A
VHPVVANFDPLIAPSPAEDGPAATTDEPETVVRPSPQEPQRPTSSRRDWRWWVASLGKLMIVTGLLMLGFVAYQLWGTGLETARAQRALESDFEELLADAGTVIEAPADAPPTSATQAADDADAAIADPPAEEPEAAGGDAEATTSDQATASIPDQEIPVFEEGDALARLEIPSIGVDDIVVAGVTTEALKKGPGHFSDTPMPGQLGNSAIAGHRTTYGQPFHNIDQLEPGDDVVITTLTGQYVYVVTGQQIVSPSDYHVVTTTDPTRATLTLTSCHPKWTANQRIVVSGELAPARSSALAEPLSDDAPDEASAATTDDGDLVEAAPDTTEAGTVGGAVDEPTVSGPSPTASDDGIADAFSEGWFSDPAALWHVAFWGLVLLAIWLGARVLSRRTRHVSIGVAAAVIPFVVCLYFFYQNVNRLLPPNL